MRVYLGGCFKLNSEASTAGGVNRRSRQQAQPSTAQRQQRSVNSEASTAKRQQRSVNSQRRQQPKASTGAAVNLRKQS